MRVQVSPRFAIALPGQPVAIAVEVFNTEQLISGHRLRVLGVDSSWASLDKESISLFPGATGVIGLTVRLPKGSLAGTRLMSIEVEELTEPWSSEVVNVELEVPARPSVTLKLDPVSVQGGRRASIVALVANTGNTVEQVALAGADDEGRARFCFTPPSLRVAPGESKAATVTVRAPRPWLGNPKVRAFTLTSTGGAAAPAQAFGSFVQRPWASRGYLALAGLLCVATVFAAVLTSALSQLGASSANDANAVMQALQASVVSPAEPSGETAGGELAGFLRFSSGQGVGGATVDLYDPAAPATPLASVATGERGSYRFVGLAPGTYKVEFQGVGFSPVWYPDSATPDGAADLVVTAGHQLGGVDATVAGLPGVISGTVSGPSPGGATVRLVSTRPAAIAGQVGMATTDATGNFILTNVPTPGGYKLVVTKPGYLVARQAVTLVSGQDDLGLKVFLPLGEGSIAGTVRTPWGPLAGATVAVSTSDAGGQVTVSTVSLSGRSAGSFALRQLPTPARFTMVVSAAGYATETLLVQLKARQHLHGESVLLPPATGMIWGQVSVAGGGPAQSVLVTVSGGKSAMSTSTLSVGLSLRNPQDGRELFSLGPGGYVLSGLPVPGSYQVTFSKPGLVPITREVQFVLGGPKGSHTSGIGVHLDVTMQVATASIYGVVEGQRAKGLPQVSVLLMSGGTSYEVTSADLPNMGAYEIDNVVPGAYTLTFVAKGALPVARVVKLAAGEHLHYDVHLAPTAEATVPAKAQSPVTTTTSVSSVGATSSSCVAPLPTGAALPPSRAPAMKTTSTTTTAVATGTTPAPASTRLPGRRI
jgi:hypothetical protein